MDRETPPTTSKRGRKGRTPKSRQSADAIKTSRYTDSPGPIGAVTGDPGLPSNFHSTETSLVENSYSSNDPAEQSFASSSSSQSSDANDNLLMPPPAQPDNIASCSGQKMHTDVEGCREHELFVDGFSILSFSTEQEVGVSNY